MSSLHLTPLPNILRVEAVVWLARANGFVASWDRVHPSIQAHPLLPFEPEPQIAEYWEYTRKQLRRSIQTPHPRHPSFSMGPLWTVLLCSGVLLLLKMLRKVVRSRRYPPGPKGLPLVGNVLDMPSLQPWLTMEQWVKKYGDVVFVENLGQPMLILNSYEATVDLLDRRSAIYSDRPKFPMLCGIMKWDWALTLVPYGEKFRRLRWFIHKNFGSHILEEHRTIQANDAQHLLLNILRSPADYVKYLRLYAGSTIMMIAYGHKVQPEEDHFVTLAEKTLSTLSEAGCLPGTVLVDIIPWLKYIPSWFPWAEFKRKGIQWSRLSLAMLNEPYEQTKEKIKNGTALPSMVTKLIKLCTGEDGMIQDEELIAGSAAVAYAGGSDTTVSVISSFILAAVLNPEVVRQAHEEIDRVIGRDRLPTFEDRPSLPYIEGIVREALRWRPVLPLCIIHRLMVDDEYKGYLIPAGTDVVANQWAILHDEKEYPNPDAFLPERWIPSKGIAVPRHPSNGAFGFGRRKCPGRLFADNSVFIAIASILATFDISKALDKNGQPITPEVKYNSGLLTYPAPFKCQILPRHENVEQLILKVSTHE